MATDRLAQAVRQQLRLGRLLPLGGPEDGAWLTERAADAVLRRAADAVPGVRLGALRIALAEPEAAVPPAVPAPPSALPPGPLRVEAECAATVDRPLPETADRLRGALLGAAAERLGLAVGAVDLRVTDVLEEVPGRPPAEEPPRRANEPDDGSAVAAAVTAVPGVARLAPVLSHQAVRIEGPHVRVELAVAPGHRALDVARAVRGAVAATAPPPATVAVLVTAVDDGG
ncbi:hypothetical protein [Streptomyces sp. Rer75]|uniref:hypothetical protein n=1 Tax=unclassified Streptomyces TaxID=2593676 RepID=UPI0015D0AA10|nr:hypothetical protein [Streptomyces sp. Rer75]QLH20961.1 hypothetical protein HYQ63_10320 [Streptomyces sp. Rer75]